MRCEKCGWTPQEPVPTEEQTRVMVDHFEEEHPAIFE